MPLHILIPFWGAPAYLKETVESVLAQHNGDWRLTVVDDAYPDESIAAYFSALGDSRVSYVRKDRNEGITANFRSCVALAAEEFITILGCDDVLLPNYVDTVLNALRHFPDADIVQPGVQIIDDDGRIVSTLADTVKQRLVRPRGLGPRILKGEPLVRSLMYGDWLYWPSLVFRTTKIRDVEFNDDYAVIQDLALIVDMLAKGAYLLLEPTVCFSYRRHSKSASSEKLVDGSRFDGERDYYKKASLQVQALGWRKASTAARLRLTSRAHALLLAPRAGLAGDSRTLGKLLRHGLGV